MRWHDFSRADLAAIAVGGTAGASLRYRLATRDSIDSVLVWDPPELADANIQLNGSVMDGNLLIFIYGVPYGTILVNLLGCLILGFLTAAAGFARDQNHKQWMAGAAIGFCGSLTTFSTFAVDAAQLLRGRPMLADKYPDETMYFDPAVADGVLYLTLSIVGGALAFWLGRLVAQRSVTTPGDVTRRDAT